MIFPGVGCRDQDADGSGTLGLPELVQGVLQPGKLHVTVMGVPANGWRIGRSETTELDFHN